MASRSTWAGLSRLAVVACLGTGVFFGSASDARAAQDKGPDYAALADDFVRSLLPPELLVGREPSAIGLDELLELAYVHLDLGVFRLHYPKRSFVSPIRGKAEYLTYEGKPNPSTALKEYATVASALTELQLRWVQLVGQEEPGKVLEGRSADAALPGYSAVSSWVATDLRGKNEEKSIVEALRKQAGVLDTLHGGPPPEGFAGRLSCDVLQASTGEEDPVRAAFASFGETMLSGSYFGVTKAAPKNDAPGALPSAVQGETDPPRPKDVVICPTRGDLVGFALYAARDRGMPELTWHPGIFEYTQFGLIGVQAIALHYAEDGNPQNMRAGRYMGDLDEPGGVIAQHAVAYAMNMLLEYYFGPNYLGDVEVTTDEQIRAQLELGSLYGGARKFMVTYLYRKNQIRDEGDEANRTHARSMFIAGGNSKGGSLGMMPAENSRWRKRASKEGDFVGDLTDNMEFERVGTGDDQRIQAKIQLQPLGSKKKNGVDVFSPFLARLAKDVLPPETGPADEKDKDREKRLQVRGELARDYVGFTRAYEIAFYKWLVEECEPKGSTSLAAHAALYHALEEIARARLQPGGPTYDLSTEYVAALERVYGMPLTNPPGTPEPAPMTLEQRFLRWLSEQ